MISFILTRVDENLVQIFDSVDLMLQKRKFQKCHSDSRMTFNGNEGWRNPIHCLEIAQVMVAL